MYIGDVTKQEECRSEALQELRKLGIKCRPKKMKTHGTRSGKKVFKVPLGQLPTETVTLKSGQQIAVPKLVHELCSLIAPRIETEGVFRKEGSKVRQNELKSILDEGKHLNLDYPVTEVASVLKLFLRELPDPLIPHNYHELFLRCVLLEKNQLDAILLACLMLPLEHLNTLSYLMQFFQEITTYSGKNKMNAYNLAVVIGPTAFPIEEKLSYDPKMRMDKTVQLFQMLIENAHWIGLIPKTILDQLSTLSLESERRNQKKKRRSGSLTRMFNGLKKIVGGKSTEEVSSVTPDLLQTPINMMKKRRVENGLSQKKKKELLENLPDNVLLSTPFTPCRTPVSMNHRVSQGPPKETAKECFLQSVKEKKWFSRSRSVKNLLKHEETTGKRNANAALERRWSSIAPPNTQKKNKKRNSYAGSLPHLKAAKKPDQVPPEPEPDYIRIPKVEYEQIKTRLSAMEREINLEMENVQSLIQPNEPPKDVHMEVDANIKNVQTVYERTLVEAEQLSHTTDQLAKRLSRELKIRRSNEQKIIRSPSARKIGSMRRRSREIEKNNAKLTRHQSWHVPPRGAIPRVSLKRGRPNTVQSGLPQGKAEIMETKDINRQKTRAEPVAKSDVSYNVSGSSGTSWVSAEGFFATIKSSDSDSFNSRASITRLRSQNAGMVAAKARLFDNCKDSDGSGTTAAPTKAIPRLKVGSKIGSVRCADARTSYRVRNLKLDEKKTKKSMSPRRKNGQMKQKLQMAKQYIDSTTENCNKENLPDNFNDGSIQIVALKDCNRIGQRVPSPMCSTPRTPHIKRTLNVRSPKRLCRTPGRNERGTPLRVLKTPTTHLI